jgi:tRNA nucleotidyltransferase/poly(A) polymerase
MINLKQLITEGRKEEAAVDYLKQVIKGSPFENRIFVVGGAVRDEMLGKPIKDIDFVVGLPVDGDLSGKVDYNKINREDSAVQFANYVTKKMNTGVTPKVVGQKTQTMGFRLKDIIHNGIDLSDVDLEIVASRGETYPDSEVRDPEPEEGSFVDDAERRDLTINSLFKSVSTGEVLDLTGKGFDDFKNKLLRTPMHPDKTLSDDPLRMLRTIRFYSRMKGDGWTMDDAARKALKRNSERLRIIVRDRIKTELDKIFEAPDAFAGIKDLIDSGLVKLVFPNIPITKEKVNMLRRAKNESVRKVIVFHDVPNFEVIMHDLKFTNVERTIVKEVSKLKDFFDSGVSAAKLRQFRRVAGKFAEITLDFIDSLNKPVDVMDIKQKLSALKDTPLKPPISGHDLLQLGVPQDATFGKIMGKIQNKFEEDPNTPREDYIKIIKSFL